jgi:hypothetical protein
MKNLSVFFVKCEVVFVWVVLRMVVCEKLPVIFVRKKEKKNRWFFHCGFMVACLLHKLFDSIVVSVFSSHTYSPTRSAALQYALIMLAAFVVVVCACWMASAPIALNKRNTSNTAALIAAMTPLAVIASLTRHDAVGTAALIPAMTPLAVIASLTRHNAVGTTGAAKPLVGHGRGGGGWPWVRDDPAWHVDPLLATRVTQSHSVLAEIERGVGLSSSGHYAGAIRVRGNKS